MKLIRLVLLVLLPIVGFSQSPPVEPKFMGGGIQRFYQFITEEIDFSKVQQEKTMRVIFYLDAYGVMNDITTTEFKNQAASEEVTRVLKKAPKWDVSNQDKRFPYIKYKIKLLFSDKKVLGETQTGWFSTPPMIEKKSEVKQTSLTDVPTLIDNVAQVNKSNEEDNNIYNTAGIEKKPDFPGGLMEFYKYIGQNFKTPDVKGLAGKVFVTFVVEKDGSIKDVKVLGDIGYGTGEEAIRVLKNSPNWIPAEQKGRKVRVLYSLPISIQPTK